jgi:hypothetical protein
MVVVNPSPSAGPPVRALSLNLGRSGTATRYSVGVDRGAASIIRGVVFSKRLSALAKKAKLPKIKLTAEDKDELTKLMEATPALKKQLDSKAAYAPSEGLWLEEVELKGKTNEPLVVFVNPKLRSGHGSVIQWAEDGTAACGFTFRANNDE